MFIRCFFLIYLLTLLSGCLKDSTVRIGVMGSFSGKYSAMGKEIRCGTLLAIEHFKRKHGKRFPIEILTYDGQGSSQQIASILQDIKKDKVQFIIGPLTSNVAYEIMVRQKSKDVLFISPSVTTDLLSRRDDTLIKLAGPASLDGEKIGQELLKDKKLKAILLYDSSNQEYVDAVMKGLSIHYPRQNFISEIDFSKWNKEDFFLKTGEIVKQRVEAIVFIGSGIDGAGFIQNLGKLGFSGQFYGPSWVNTNNFIRHSGNFSEGVKIISFRMSENNNKEYLIFESEYLEYFNDYPEWIAINSYDAATILLETLLETKQRDVQSIRNKILSKNSYNGIQEKFIIDQFGDVVRETAVLWVKQGRFVQVKDE